MLGGTIRSSANVYLCAFRAIEPLAFERKRSELRRQRAVDSPTSMAPPTG